MDKSFKERDEVCARTKRWDKEIEETYAIAKKKAYKALRNISAGNINIRYNDLRKREKRVTARSMRKWADEKFSRPEDKRGSVLNQ